MSEILGQQIVVDVVARPRLRRRRRDGFVTAAATPRLMQAYAIGR